MATTQIFQHDAPVRKYLRKDTFQGHITDLIATSQSLQPGEQAFLVEQDPNWVTPTHYHGEYQFQVVTAGYGTIGRHDVKPLCVHYASPETAYGPIVAGQEGVSYLTMRMSGEVGAWYIHKPGSRERMQVGLKREQQHGGAEQAVDAQALESLTQTTVEVLIEPRADGLAAHLLRIAPGQEYALAAQHAHGGRYYVLTQGSAKLAGKPVQSLSVAFASAEESLAAVAGEGGAELVVLQFPIHAVKADTLPLGA